IDWTAPPNVDGDWFDAGNWSSGVPNAGTPADIDNGTAHIDGGNAEAQTLSLNGGGELTLYAGTLDVSGPVILGSDSGSSGTINVAEGMGMSDADAILNATTLVVGSAGHGELHVSNGEVNVDGALFVGNQA